jgi:hypothetical protein
MLTLMVEGGRRWFLSIFVRAVNHTKSEHFFSREIDIPSTQIHRKCFNKGLYGFLCSINLYLQ